MIKIKEASINCPNCGATISIDDVLASRVAEKLKEEKIALQKEAEALAKKESALEIELLTSKLKEREAKLDEAIKEELKLRAEKDKLEEAKKDFEVQKQRELAAAKQQLEEGAYKKAQEDQQFVIAELNKKISDATRVNEELNRKLQQGSQQAQGEVFELELEERLKEEFPYDEIIPVAKGKNGADITQVVKDKQGRKCGTIVWEAKRTKGWSEGWIQKIKDDQREVKAEVSVIVSIVLPEDVKTHNYRDGVWVTNYESVIGLATALRINLIQVMLTKLVAVGKNEKMEIIYHYLTGTGFKQRVEAIVEAFGSMKGDLEAEKNAYKKIWAKRELQIGRVIDNTYGLYGDLEGIVGTSLPHIKLLELPEVA